MQDERHANRRAANERDAAQERVRRVTGMVVAASLAVAGSLAGYVSSAASGRKLVRRAVVPARPVRAAPRKAAVVPVPPAPPPPALIQSSSPPPPAPSPPSSDDSSPPPSAPQTPQAPQAPAQAPVPVQAPPVVVSGGS